jgi:hypothetical protein
MATVTIHPLIPISNPPPPRAFLDGPGRREAASGHQCFSTSARRILLSAVVRLRFLAVRLDPHLSLGLRRGLRFGS